MPVAPRRNASKPSRKVSLQKASASEMLRDLGITPIEVRHAKRALASAMRQMTSTHAAPAKSSELRVSEKRVGKRSKSGAK